MSLKEINFVQAREVTCIIIVVKTGLMGNTVGKWPTLLDYVTLYVMEIICVKMCVARVGLRGCRTLPCEFHVNTKLSVFIIQFARLYKNLVAHEVERLRSCYRYQKTPESDAFMIIYFMSVLLTYFYCKVKTR